MLGNVPRWLLPWSVTLGLVVAVLLVAVLPSAYGAVAIVLVIWGIPLGFIGYRHVTGHDADDDGMPTGRLDSLLRHR